MGGATSSSRFMNVHDACWQEPRQHQNSKKETFIYNSLYYLYYIDLDLDVPQIESTKMRTGAKMKLTKQGDIIDRCCVVVKEYRIYRNVNYFHPQGILCKQHVHPAANASLPSAHPASRNFPGPPVSPTARKTTCTTP